SVDKRIVAALRIKIGILMPEEIFQNRARFAMSQQELAEQLGVAKETISRWETGALIQSRAMDNLMRLYFESEEVRRLLRNRFAHGTLAPANRLFKRAEADSSRAANFCNHYSDN